MMSVKKMIDLYIRYELSEDTWNMMWNMANHGLISRNNWVKFYETCKSWEFDTEDDRNVVNEYGEIIYTRNADGYLVKVA